MVERIEKNNVPLHSNRLKLRIGFNIQFLTVFFTALAICDSLVSIYVAIIPTIVRYAILLVWALSAIIYIERMKRLKSLAINIVPCAIFATIYLFKLIIGKNYSDDFWSPVRMFNDIAALFFCIVMVHVIVCMPKAYKRLLVKLFLIFGSITVIPSLFYIRIYPDAVRDAYDGFANVNFTYIYASVLMTVFAFYMLKTRKVKYKVCFLLFFITNLILIISANFATAFIGVIVGICLMLFCTKKSRFKKTVAISICLIIVFIISIPLISKICYSMASYDGFSAVMQRRLNAIGDFLLGKDGGSSFNNRFDLMELSWEAFKKHPILGIPFSQYRRGTIGLHETWISMLGSMGIVGTSMFLISIIILLRTIFSNIKLRFFKVSYGMILSVYLFISFLNPMATRDCLVAAFVILPLFESCMSSSCVTHRSADKKPRFMYEA